MGYIARIYQNIITSDLYKLVCLEAITATLIATGLLNQNFAWLLLALLVAFVLTKPLKQSLELLLLSLPFFLALPFGTISDSMSMWRPLSLILVLVWLWRRRDILWKRPLVFWQRLLQKRYLLYLSGLAMFLLLISLVSLLWAEDIGIGVKTIIYLVNGYLIFFLFAWEIKSKDLLRFLRAGAFVSGIALIVAFVQFDITLFVPLHEFWQWWTDHPIRAYYGGQTSELLSYSNTWFSYYGEDVPATLRMFSFFQDSHAFAMMSIWAVAIFLAFRLFYKKTGDKKGIRLSGILVIIALLAIILSGTRGAWLGGGVLLFIALAFAYTKELKTYIPEHYSKKALYILIAFVLLFPLASFLLYGEQHAQLRLEGREGGADFRVAFLRARSTFDIGELSNKGRLEIWQDAFNFLKETKTLTGAGVGNFASVIHLHPETSRIGASAHSLYVQILVELGILGFLASLAVIYLIILRAYKIFTQNEGEFVAYFAFAFLISFLWILLHSVADITLLNDKIFLLSAMLAGILFGISEKQNI